MAHAEIPQFLQNPFEQTRNTVVRAEKTIGRFADRAMTRMGLPEDSQLRYLAAFGLLGIGSVVVGTAALFILERIP